MPASTAPLTKKDGLSSSDGSETGFARITTILLPIARRINSRSGLQRPTHPLRHGDVGSIAHVEGAWLDPLGREQARCQSTDNEFGQELPESPCQTHSLQ
jgi:hypothetical protein